MPSNGLSVAIIMLREKSVRRGRKNAYESVHCAIWTALLFLVFCRFNIHSFLPSGKFQDTYIQIIAMGAVDVSLLAKSLSIVSTPQIAGPRVLMSKFSQADEVENTTDLAGFDACMVKPEDWAAPPHRASGYLWFRANGGLNQMRAAICDMVAIARHLKAILVIPDLDESSYWSDSSGFADLFDIDHFIDSLKSEVHIVKELPETFEKNMIRKFHSLIPISWSSMGYYKKVLRPLLKQHKVVYIHESDSRLANNSPHVPPHLQKLRCRVQYQALKFTPAIRALAQTIVQRLKARGPYLALHLRYEKDMLAFTGCSLGCTGEEEQELTELRHKTGRWKVKDIDGVRQRLSGKCPMTPEEVVVLLQALGFKNDTQIYIAAGDTFGGQRRMTNLISAFSNTVSKEMILSSHELSPFRNHSSQLAAIDYIISLHAHTFFPTYPGNMARLVEGHRRVLGHKESILPNVRPVVRLIDSYHSGNSSWKEVVNGVTRSHLNRMGAPQTRLRNAKNPKAEDNFYQNPIECMCHPLEVATPI